MVQSMTGFANKTITLTDATGQKTHIAMSLKSLNYRFFETTFKLPHAISYLETDLIKLCKKKLTRGHIYLTVHMNNPALFHGSVEPALKVIDGYVQAIEQIKTRYGITQQLAIDHIVRLPDAFLVEEKGLDPQTEKNIMAGINELISAVLHARAQEGINLVTDIKNRMKIMQQEIEYIDAASQELIKLQKEKIHATAAELQLDTPAFGQNRQDALYALLDKIDIHEEIIRFKSHQQSITEHLNSDTIEKGKQLDFTLQELGREINTITAKCSDAQIGKRAINVKVEIEKAREQVQNIV